MPFRHGRGVRHGRGARDCLGSLGTVPMPFRHGRGACRTAWSLRLLDGNLDDREPAKAGKLPDLGTSQEPGRKKVKKRRGKSHDGPLSTIL